MEISVAQTEQTFPVSRMHVCPAAMVLWGSSSKPITIKVERMKPTEEEIALRQQQLRRQAQQRLAQAGATKRSAPADAAAARAATPPPVTAPKASGSSASSGLAAAGLVIALGALGAAGYMYTLLQKSDQKYAAAQEILLQQGSKIEALENRLSASGENANLSVDALKVVLREQDNEIRKLWDLASKRNRADIDANAAKLGNLNTAMNSASGASASDLKALRSKVTELENAVAALPSGLEISIAQNKESIEMLGSSIKSLRSDIADIDSAPSSGGAVGYNDLTNMKLEIEDIQIRLDRIQNAMSGG
jgi:hypothetical protein